MYEYSKVFFKLGGLLNKASICRGDLSVATSLLQQVHPDLFTEESVFRDVYHSREDSLLLKPFNYFEVYQDDIEELVKVINDLSSVLPHKIPLDHGIKHTDCVAELVIYYLKVTR